MSQKKLLLPGEREPIFSLKCWKIIQIVIFLVIFFSCGIVFDANGSIPDRLPDLEQHQVNFGEYTTYTGPVRNFAKGIEIIDENDDALVFTAYENSPEYVKILSVCTDPRLPAGVCSITTHPYGDDEIISAVAFFPHTTGMYFDPAEPYDSE